jgi:WD40 repeat protein
MRTAVWVGTVLAIAGSGLVAAERKETPELLLTLDGHRGGVTTIAFSANSERIVTGAGNGLVRLWDVKSGKLIVKLEEFSRISITGLAISPDGKTIAASGRGKVGMWTESDTKSYKSDATNTPVTGPKGETKYYKWLSFPNTDSEAVYADVAITGDSKEIYFARRHAGVNYPGRIYRFDTVHEITDERPGPKMIDPRAIACVFDPDSGVAAVYGSISDKEEAAVLLYGFGDPKIITRGVPPLTKNTYQKIAFSPDSRWLCAYSGSLAVWPVPGSHIIGGMPIKIEGVTVAAIGPDNLMATVSPKDEARNAEIIIRELSSRTKQVEEKMVATIPTTLQDVSYLAFSPNGRILAVGGSKDGVVQLWNMDGR